MSVSIKKYLLFAGADYYAEGGMHDFINTFDTVEEAKQYAVNMCERHEDEYCPTDWVQIVEVSSLRIVYIGRIERIDYAYHKINWKLKDDRD